MSQQPFSALIPLERACFRVVALILSRLMGRDIQTELHRLNTQGKLRSYGETGVVLGALLGLTLLAASFGFWALSLYIIGVFLAFR
jgi:hypothetical protein